MLTREQTLLLEKHHDRETLGVEAAEARRLIESSPDAERYLLELSFLRDLVTMPSFLDSEGLPADELRSRILLEIEARSELEEESERLLAAAFRRDQEGAPDAALLARIMASVGELEQARESVAATSATPAPSLLERLRAWGSGWVFTGAVATAAALLAVGVTRQTDSTNSPAAVSDAGKTTIINNYYVTPRVDSLSPTSGFTGSVTQGSETDDIAPVIWLQPNGTLGTAPAGSVPASEVPPSSGSGTTAANPVHTD